jgi:hypothetical protein
MNDFISCGVVMSEPERLGYTTYLECIKSLLSFSDEVVVILSRKEESSEEKIRQLKDDRIRVINTETWPAKGWDYDTVCEHFQMIVDECVGDYVFKVDPDRVFRSEYGEHIRNVILNECSDKHWIDFGRVNFFGNDLYKFFDIGDWGLNVKLLHSDGIKYSIQNREQQVMPSMFYDWRQSGYKDEFESCGSIVKRYGFYPDRTDEGSIIIDVDNLWYMPINYDCVFMTKDLVVSKYKTFMQAVNLSYPERKDSFDPAASDEAVLVSWINSHRNKMAGSVQLKNFHPGSMSSVISDIDENSWGYNNWGYSK